MKKLSVRIICLMLLATILLITTSCKGNKTIEKTKIRIEFDDSTSIFNYIIELRNVFPEYEFEFQSIVRRGHIDRVEAAQGAEVVLSQAAINNDVADIIISDAFKESLPNLKGAFAEVSGESYTANFQTSQLNNISIDGELYYLPFFIGLKGIIYNQTLFEENGWGVPQNYNEFLNLLTTIYDSGLPPISVRTLSEFGSGLFGTSYLINDGSTIEGYEWQKEFSKGNPDASADTFTDTLSYLRMLNEVGHVADDLALLERPIAYLMKDREVAMCIANGESLSQIYNSGTHDKFAMMPLYSEKFPNGVIIEHNTLYLGMSAKSMKDSEKSLAMNEIISYIYSEKGQLRLLESCRGLISPCYGLMEELSSLSLSEFKRVLDGGNLVKEITSFAIDKTFNKDMLEYLANDVTDESDTKILKALNEARAIWLDNKEKQQEVITIANENFSLQQGLNLLLQAMLIQTNSDVSIAPTSTIPDYYGHYHDTQLVISKLYKGEVTTPILKSLLVSIFNVNVYEMTGEQLLALVDCNATNNICLGIIPEHTYDNEKEIYITTGAYFENGDKVNLNDVYQVSVPSNISVGTSGYITMEVLDETLLDILLAYCKNQDAISPFDIPEQKYVRRK